MLIHLTWAAHADPPICFYIETNKTIFCNKYYLVVSLITVESVLVESVLVESILVLSILTESVFGILDPFTLDSVKYEKKVIENIIIIAAKIFTDVFILSFIFINTNIDKVFK